LLFLGFVLFGSGSIIQKEEVAADTKRAIGHFIRTFFAVR